VFKADVSGLSTFDPGSDTVLVGDKTGYSLAQAFPTNFANLAIDGSGNILAGNMRGTDNALLAASYTAPDNASIAEILTDTGTTIPAQISALNNLSQSQAQTAAATALSDYSPPTKAEATSDKNEVLSAIVALPTPGDATLASQVAIISSIDNLGSFESPDRTKLEEIHRFRSLDPSSPITTDKTGATTTETDGVVTITHVADTDTETLVSTRTG